MNNRTFSIVRDNSTYYGQLIGTLLQSAVITHLYHFKTVDMWTHKAMEEYYEGIVDLVDSLAEKILEPLSMDLLYENVIDQKGTPTEYFEALKAFCIDMKSQLFSNPEDSNYASIMDDMVNLISETLYRLKRFTSVGNENEGRTFSEKKFSHKIFDPGTYNKNSKEYKYLDKMDEKEWQDYLDEMASYGLSVEYNNVEDSFIITGSDIYSKKTYSEDDFFQEFLDEYGINKGDKFFFVAAIPDLDKGKYEVVMDELTADEDTVSMIVGEDEFYMTPYSIQFDKDKASKVYKEYKSKYDNKKLIRNTPYSKKRSYSDANGVKPAPERFAVIYIPKGENKIDCNASYKEPDKEPIACFVPDGGYGIMDAEVFIKSLQINNQEPKYEHEVMVVPMAKVKLHDQIGHL